MACRCRVSTNQPHGHHADVRQRWLGRLSVLLVLALSLVSPLAHADLLKPEGQVLLTISGQIQETNRHGRAEFDRDMLEDIGMVAFETKTPWTKEQVRFAGVPFTWLLDAVSAKGPVARAIAANDYKADIPIATLRETGAILAMQRNGEDMTLRDKGPLWIVFPWSQNPDLQHSEIYNYSVWQLISLHIQ